MEPRGLNNPRGANNCWLNATVQLLWHLDIFRSSIIKLSGYGHFRCQEEKCVFCHVKSLMFEYEHTEELSIPPNALRNALAKTCSSSFSMGKLGDPIEAYQAVLQRLHSHLVSEDDGDSCGELHCIVHRKFAMNVVEQNVCQRCEDSSEPTSSWDLFRWVSSRDILGIGKTGKTFNSLLLQNTARRCEATRPGSNQPCNGKSAPAKALLNAPDVFSICIGWDTNQSKPEEIHHFLERIPVQIILSDIFTSALDPLATEPLTLVGIVCYYGLHYSLFFHHSRQKTWIYLDDSMVNDIGAYWDDVKNKIIKGHHQPCMAVYTKLNTIPLNVKNAPKFTVIDREAFIEDEKEDLNNAYEKNRLVREAQEIADLEYARAIEKIEIEENQRLEEEEKLKNLIEERKRQEEFRDNLLRNQEDIYDTIQRQNRIPDTRLESSQPDHYQQGSNYNRNIRDQITPDPIEPPPKVNSRSNASVDSRFQPIRHERNRTPTSFPEAIWDEPPPYEEPKSEPLLRLDSETNLTRVRSSTSDLIRLDSDPHYPPPNYPKSAQSRNGTKDRNKEKIKHAISKTDSQRRKTPKKNATEPSSNLNSIPSTRRARNREASSQPTNASYDLFSVKRNDDKIPSPVQNNIDSMKYTNSMRREVKPPVDDYDRPSSRAVQPNFTLNPKLISHQPNRQYVEYPRPSTVPSYSWNRPNKDLTNNEPYLRESAGIDYVPQTSKESEPSPNDLIDMDKPADSSGMHNVKQVFKSAGVGLGQFTRRGLDKVSKFSSNVSTKVKSNNQGAQLPLYQDMEQFHPSRSREELHNSTAQTSQVKPDQSTNINNVLRLSEPNNRNRRK